MITTQPNIRERVLSIIAKHHRFAIADIELDDNLRADFGSWETTEAIIAIEDEFGIEIISQNAGPHETVQQLIDLVEKMVAGS